jgi:hypothetical protein
MKILLHLTIAGMALLLAALASVIFGSVLVGLAIGLAFSMAGTILTN